MVYSEVEVFVPGGGVFEVGFGVVVFDGAAGVAAGKDVAHFWGLRYFVYLFLFAVFDMTYIVSVNIEPTITNYKIILKFPEAASLPLNNEILA